jgi:sugar phosphate isomerase/epimerase
VDESGLTLSRAAAIDDKHRQPREDAMIDRRLFLAATGAALVAPPTAFAKAARPMIGVQLYMARDLLAKDFGRTIAAIAGTGVRHVELAGLYGRSAPAVRDILAQNGLTAVGAHALRADMDDAEVERRVDDLAAIGVAYAVAPIPLMPGLATGSFQDAIKALTREDFLRTADRFNRIAATAKAGGMRFVYHTHALDFIRFGDRYAFDEMIAQCDPALVDFELDVGNTVAAGVDPLPYFKRLGTRAPLAHLKDWVGPFEPGPERVPATAPIGTGVVDFPATMRAMTASGVRYAFIEDENRPADDVIAAIGSAYRYLSGL